MTRLDQLIAEIKEIGSEPSHRNAIQIFKILDGNTALFVEKIDVDSFQPMLRAFESLSNSSAREFNSEEFKRDYNRNYELLSFHLNRI